MKLLHVVILSFGISMSGGLVGWGIVKYRTLGNFVEVRGLSEQIVKSDIATWNINFVVASEDIATLSKEIEKVQTVVYSYIEQSGFPADEITKLPVSVSDSHTNQYGELKGARYRASGGITLRTERVDVVSKASENLDELLDTGIVLSGSNVRYHFARLNDIKPEMLKRATANAREAAISFAEDSGASVGSLKSAWQGLFTIRSPTGDYDSGQSMEKMVRVVMTAHYFLN